MKETSSRYVIAIVSLLVFLLAGQAGVQGYVLCLGEDGHAALEYGQFTGCDAGAEQYGMDCHEGICDLSSQREDCGPCLDVPASLDAASRRIQGQKNFPAQMAFIAAVQVAPGPNILQVLTTNLYPQPPPRISQTILSHRTVVLLN